MKLHDVYDCPQCDNKITLPPEMSEEDQIEIAGVCRRDGKIQSMALIQRMFNLGLVASKVMMAHISDPKDQCANCKSKLLETGITYCPSCNGLNLNW